MQRRYTFQPANRDFLIGHGVGNVEPGRAGDVVRLTDRRVAGLLAAVAGVGGAPCLVADVGDAAEKAASQAVLDAVDGGEDFGPELPLSAVELATLHGNNLGASSGGGSDDPVATIKANGLAMGMSTLTVTIDGELKATLSFANNGGGNSSRTGVGTGEVDMGGGVGDDANSFAGQIGYVLRLLADAGDLDVVVEPLATGLPYRGAAGALFDIGGGITVRAVGATSLVLDTDEGDLTLTNP